MTVLKRLSLIATCILLLTLTAFLFTSCGGENYENGIIYNGTTVTGADKTATSLTVKDGTTTIAAGAFEGCTQLTSLILPDSITEIAAGAFTDCTALIKTEGGVKYVDDWAVGAENGVHEITVKDGTRGIAREAFAGQSQLKKAIIPDSVKYISARAFFRCTSIEEMTLPFVGRSSEMKNYTHFGYIFGAFNKEQNSDYVPETLTKVTLTAATVIADDAFASCKKISSVTVPDTLLEIGERAFSNCTALSSITIPDSVKSIGAKAFYECSALEEVKLPNNESFTSLSEYTFAYCSSIKTLVIPKSVVYIDACSIARCTNLEEITIEAPLIEKIGQQAFDGCKYLKKISFASKIIGKAAFQNCIGLDEVTLGTGTVSIESYAFNGCSGVTAFLIPESIRQIGEYSFYGCHSITSFTIPEGVEKIEKTAFQNCINLSEITIPESVKAIGTNAFAGCNKLIKKTDGVSYLNSWIIEVQPSVTALEIDATVSGFAEGAFDDAVNLTKIIYSGTADGLEEIKNTIPSKFLPLIEISVSNT